MKKLILNPSKDTVTICLPSEWVGKPLVCILKGLEEENATSVVSYVSEDSIFYRAMRYREQPKRGKRRTKRLRKRDI